MYRRTFAMTIGILAAGFCAQAEDIAQGDVFNDKNGNGSDKEENEENGGKEPVPGKEK